MQRAIDRDECTRRCTHTNAYTNSDGKKSGWAEVRVMSFTLFIKSIYIKQMLFSVTQH